MNKIDLSEIQLDVISKWNEDGFQYLNTSHTCGSNIIPGGMYELELTAAADIILDDIYAMLEILGFDSIANYILFKDSHA